ncbi:hypothetical protein B0H13DRAFT_2661360 [Mycena leptocephala]|nr:hypothetical protein B0H13DRAFT_2661360 [Mycena leptocephala]
MPIHCPPRHDSLRLIRTLLSRQLAGWKALPEGSQPKLQPLLGPPGSSSCLIEVAIAHRILVTWQCGLLLIELYRLFLGVFYLPADAATLPPAPTLSPYDTSSRLPQIAPPP